MFPRFSMHFWLSGSALNRPPALFAVSQRPIAVLTRRESYLALLSAAPPVEMGAVGLYMTQLKTCAEYSRSRRRPVALSRWSSPRWSSTACHFAPARRCMHWLIAPLSTLIQLLLPAKLGTYGESDKGSTRQDVPTTDDLGATVVSDAAGCETALFGPGLSTPDRSGLRKPSGLPRLAKL